jgi:hypothetical protein
VEGVGEGGGKGKKASKLKEERGSCLAREAFAAAVALKKIFNLLYF